MKIGMDDKFWMVADPRPGDGLEDCCFEVSLSDLEMRFAAGLTCRQRPAIFTEREEADVEARARLLARDVAKLATTGGEMFEEAVRVQILDADGDVIFTAPVGEQARG